MQTCKTAPAALLKKLANGVAQFGPIVLCCYYALCSMVFLLTRFRFVPYNQFLYAAVLIVATVGVCAAGVWAPPEDGIYYRPRRYVFAGLLPVFTAFYLSDITSVLSPWLSAAVIVICMAAVLKLFFACVQSVYFRGVALLATAFVGVFCLVLWLSPLLYPVSETTTVVEKLYNDSGCVAVVTDTRIFGNQIKTEVCVYECSPSLGLGRFEKSYTSRAFVELADCKTPAQVELRWEGELLYINGVQTAYPLV